MKRLIVTGATGSIGCSIVARASERGYEVTCIVRKGTERISNIPSCEHVSIVECDLADYHSLEMGNGYDAFIHLAWDGTFGTSRDNAELQMKNIQYTLDAVQLAKRCGCTVFVGAGSQAEYGVQDVSLTPDLPVNPESGYGIAKYAAGRLSAMLCRNLEMRQCWVRILSVYGFFDTENSLIRYLIREFGAGRSPELTECGQMWDYLYAGDAADAFLDVVEKGHSGAVYPLGSGHGRRLSEYVEDVRRVVNPSVQANYGAKEYYPHQPMHLVADISALREDTGFEPKTDFAAGIRETVDYLGKQ